MKQGGECRWLGNRLGLYLDGELGSRGMKRANRHLEECHHCRREVAFLSESLEAARGLRTVAPGPDFEDAVWERIQIARTVEQQRPWWTRFEFNRPLVWASAGALGTAAAALLIITVLPIRPFDSAPRMAESSKVSAAAKPVLALQGSPAETPPHDTPSTATPSTEGVLVEDVRPIQGPSPTPVYGRLEPPGLGAEGTLVLDRVDRLRDPWVPDRGYYVMPRLVVTQGDEAYVSF